MKWINYIALLPLLIYLAGCTGVKSSLDNFRAHYNSFYNAEKSYSKGLEKIKEQEVNLDPSQPISVHIRPLAVSNPEFQKSIDKCAQILRKFPDSKWTDDALLLIGKSYYYQRDFFQAIQKFEELKALTGKDRLKAEATLWKGKALLAGEEFGEGISYLLNELDAVFWQPRTLAEAELLLGELFAMRENWEQSSSFLGAAIRNLPRNEMKSRAYFLYGQVLEEQGRFGEAIYAFGQVRTFYPDYEYIYWSDMKRAEVARKEGNMDMAISIYRSMAKDDKNFSRRADIRYEVARTLEMEGRIAGAKVLYNRLLRMEVDRLPRDIQGRIYYRMGKIFSEEHGDLSKAAAYFDSSSTYASSLEIEGEKRDARMLASAYHRYTSLKETAARLDSLLWLGSLPPAELDSVIAEARSRKKRQIEERLEREEVRSNRLLNLNRGRSGENNVKSTVYGFLNYRNARLVRESVNEFRVVWGERPLMDNWRRAEAVRRAGAQALRQGDSENSAGNAKLAGTRALKLDLSEIPSTPEQKSSYRQKRAQALYELGSLFFLNLQMPDSAAYYYNEVIGKYPESPLVQRAMYALFELQSDRGKGEEARYWADTILNRFPHTEYAAKVSRRLEGGSLSNSRVDSSAVLRDKMERIAKHPDSPAPQKAEAFRQLALDNQTSRLAPYIYFRSVREYVNLAKAHSDSIFVWRQGGAKDSVIGLRASGDHIGGPVQQKPLEGAYWDSVRSAIKEYKRAFPDAREVPQLKLLEAALEYKERAITPGTCEGKGISLQVEGSMQQFLDKIMYPQEVEVKDDYQLVYRMTINLEGQVVSHTLRSPPVDERLREAVERAIDRWLNFEPLPARAAASQTRCTFRIPLAAVQ